MELLMEWVQQIIMIVLVASIIDLLMPSTTMKKYIRLVVGLIFIMIFLKPIFNLFQIDIEHDIEESMADISVEKEADSSEKNIKMQKREIQAHHDAYILEQMTSQLKDIAKGPLEKYDVDITDIQYEFSTDEEIQYDNLEELIVYVSPLDHDKGDANTIEEVKIDTDHSDETDDEEFEYIKQELKDVWELKDKQLTIKWEGGAS